MSLKLVEKPRAIVVQKGPDAIAIDRATGTISLTDPVASSGYKPLDIAGLLGLVELPYSRYLIVARTGRLAGMLANSPIFRVKSTLVLPLEPAASRDKQFVALLERHLAEATLFYSPVYDLTSSVQRTAILRESAQPSIDDRFFWNYEISKPLMSFPGFVFPVIYGVFSVAQEKIGPNAVEFAVISRRSRFRAGTRYFRRGLDEAGHAANFNETEQVVIVGDRIFSFLQTRGSVPALWSEINNLKYKPKLQVGGIEASTAAAAKHFKEQKQEYGKQFLVNLVNQNGYEKPIKQLYEDVIYRLNDKDIQYIYFDFHHECSKMRWDRVQLLIDELVRRGIDQAGWFEAKGGVPVAYQSGVVRTNCMDCLDRTNVVQSTLALHTLKLQLVAAGVISDNDQITRDKSFMLKFRNIWADNADGVSCAYSGTGALKTDFTRTGQRTRLGALKDLQNSIVRYYRNNLRDGPRQDGFSLFLGEYVPSRAEFPFNDPRTVWIQCVPYIFGFCTVVAVLSTVYPSENHSTTFNTVVTSLFSLSSVLALRFMFTHGLQYVSWPSLSSVRFVKWSPRKGYHIEGEVNSKEE